MFGRGIAKYFSNALREDGLLARCTAGTVVLAGAAGTVQEIFQGVTRLYYERMIGPGGRLPKGRPGGPWGAGRPACCIGWGAPTLKERVDRPPFACLGQEPCSVRVAAAKRDE